TRGHCCAYENGFVGEFPPRSAVTRYYVEDQYERSCSRTCRSKIAQNEMLQVLVVLWGSWVVALVETAFTAAQESRSTCLASNAPAISTEGRRSQGDDSRAT
ncbi:unnamed protein product, partial [Ectocarpus fasciculatus]